MSRGKLVRDKIPEIIRAKGELPSTRIAKGAEYQSLLLAKLSEEVLEFIASDGDPGELADILEVVIALADGLGIGQQELERLRAKKAAERGGFSQGIVWSGNLPAATAAPAIGASHPLGVVGLGRFDEQYLTGRWSRREQVLPGGWLQLGETGKGGDFLRRYTFLECSFGLAGPVAVVVSRPTGRGSSRLNIGRGTGHSEQVSAGPEELGGMA
jgi:predicted house-cleaning noncanonical NTP pyrophosphatase (MazG superfamily)